MKNLSYGTGLKPDMRRTLPGVVTTKVLPECKANVILMKFFSKLTRLYFARYCEEDARELISQYDIQIKI